MDRIKSSTEIALLFAQGTRVHTKHLTLIVLETRDCTKNTCGRVAFIAGKKNGNAVWRNRAKRRMRAICKDLGGPWPGYDIVFLAKERIIQSEYQSVMKDTQTALSSFMKKN